MSKPIKPQRHGQHRLTLRAEFSKDPARMKCAHTGCNYSHEKLATFRQHYRRVHLEGLKVKTTLTPEERRERQRGRDACEVPYVQQLHGTRFLRVH